MTTLLTAKLRAVRRKHALVSATRGLAAMAAAAVLLLAGGMAIDWALDLPRILRAAILAIDITVLCYILFWTVLYPVLFHFDDQTVALLVERHIPDFKTRLIASVQLCQPRAIQAGSSVALVHAMVAQTEELARPMDFTGIIRPEPAVRVVFLAAMFFLSGAIGMVYGKPVTSDLLARAMLSNIPVPRKTRITCLSGDLKLPIGTPVVLEASAEGVIPANGVIDIAYDSGRRQRFITDPKTDSPASFVLGIDNVQESFSYRFRLNDGQTAWFKVQAFARPTVLGVSFQQEYPAYLKRPAENRSPGDLSLLAGSRLNMKVKASQPITSATVNLVGLQKTQTLGPDLPDRAHLAGTVSIPPTGLSGISFKLVDDNGIESIGETVYPIDLILDKPPQVKITWPDRKEETATAQAKVLIGFDASDDFGLARITLWYKSDIGEQAAAQALELDMSDQIDLRRVQRRYEFNLGGLKPLRREGSTVEYWIEVADGNDVTGPGRAESEHYRVRIVSELEKRTDLMNRLNEQLGSIDFATQEQEKLNQTLGKLILQRQ